MLFMETWAYAFLIFLIVILVFVYSKLDYFEKRMEYPNAKFCSNGVIFDDKMEQKVIQYANDYIIHFVGSDYYERHIYYDGYQFQDCNVIVNYKYVVGDVVEDVYVRVLIPNQATLVVKDSNAPRHPFEMKYSPSDFGINYTSYEVNYDPELGFTYRFYYNKVPIGIGNAQTGELQRIFSTL